MVNTLNQHNQIKLLADHSGGIFRTTDLNALGINAYGIQKLIKTNVIERIKPGYYCLFSVQDELSEAAQIAQLFPDGVLCMYTALFYYQYSNRTPLMWDIAIDKDTSKSRFKSDHLLVQPYYLEPALLTFGVTTAEYADCTLKIFDRDRLVCECIFYENKMDRETYNKAIQSYINDPKKNISNLLFYSKKRRILKKVTDRIGIWL